MPAPVGAVQVTVAAPLPAVAVTAVGAPGAATHAQVVRRFPKRTSWRVTGS